MSALPDHQVKLIQAVAAANPNTVVVLNTADPVIVQPWIDNPNVKAVLEMWNAGSEGSTATARLLLGQANPSGHTAITWPRNGTDLFWTYNQTKPLYPGDTTGVHPERLNGLPNFGTSETEGIYTGYRYYDQEGIPPQFPFGFGLSYTTFEFSHLKLTPRFDGTVDVDFDITNTGSVAGAEVAQVYVGAGPDVPGSSRPSRSLRGFRPRLAAARPDRRTRPSSSTSGRSSTGTPRPQNVADQLRPAHRLGRRRRLHRPPAAERADGTAGLDQHHGHRRRQRAGDAVADARARRRRSARSRRAREGLHGIDAANVISTAGDAHALGRRSQHHGHRAPGQRGVLAPAGAAGQRHQRQRHRQRVRPGRRLAAPTLLTYSRPGLQRRRVDRVQADIDRQRRAAHRHLLARPSRSPCPPPTPRSEPTTPEHVACGHP